MLQAVNGSGGCFNLYVHTSTVILGKQCSDLKGISTHTLSHFLWHLLFVCGASWYCHHVMMEEKPEKNNSTCQRLDFKNAKFES